MKRLKLELTSPRSGGDPQGPADLTYTQEDDENQFSPLATARHGRCQEGGERKLGLVWRTSASDKVMILLHLSPCHVPVNLEIALQIR